MSTQPGALQVKRRWPRMVIAVMGLSVAAYFAVSVFESLTGTALLESVKFEGIKSTVKRTTSVVIVHGIGHHCIGYADKLVSNLLEELSGSKSEKIQDAYLRYVASLTARPVKPDAGPSSGSSGYQVDRIEPLRDGNCNRIALPGNFAGHAQVDTGDDLESVVLAEDALCRSINESPKRPDMQAYCHKLYVNRSAVHDEGENPEYVTGFVRRFDKDVSSGRRIRIYEVTWSPATRWIKQSLRDVEAFNDAMSAHYLNRFLKSQIINAGVADAIAYLSDSGVLVNNDILQTFCLTFANDLQDGTSYTDYAFSCNASQLAASGSSFAKDNEIVLITHSLGTRILFDTIGLLALGANDGKKPAPPDEPGLVEVINSKFKLIGAEYPSEPTAARGAAMGGGFNSVLARRIPEFARAIKSVYVFTNQVPLLSATLSSPFKETYGVGKGFEKFLKLHNTSPSDGTAPNRLQVVAFHDPDDFLSYNLSCWYYETILRNLQETKNILEKEALFRANQASSDIGGERSKLRETLFRKSCSGHGLTSKGDQSLFEAIWSSETNLLALKDATVRLKGSRIEGLAADPLGIHSNYFSDEAVHRWIVHGHSGVENENNRL